MSTDTSLNTLRLAIRQQRQQLDQSTQKNAAIKMAAQVIDSNLLQHGKSIAAFIAVNGEINPKFILAHDSVQQATIYMPIVQDNFGLLFAPYYANSKIVPNRYKMPEPEHHPQQLITAANIDIILTPLLAFDAQGNRLGMGSGYYDRALECRKLQTKPLLIGLAYEFQKQTSLATNEWDIPMDYVATEKQLYKFNHTTR